MPLNRNTILFGVWPETRGTYFPFESALNSCTVAPTYPAHHDQANKILPGTLNDKSFRLLKWLALLFLLVCLYLSDPLRSILEVFISSVCLLVLIFVAYRVFNFLSSGMVSDAFASFDGVSRPPRPRFFGAGFVEGTGRTVSCVVSRFLAVVGVAGRVCMGAGRVLSCVISWLLVVAVIARHPRASASGFVSSVMAWLSGCLEKVNQERASVSYSETSMPGTFPAPLEIVVPESMIHSLSSPISVPNSASQVPVAAIQNASACPSKPSSMKTLRPGWYIELLSRDRSVESLGNFTEQAPASHSMPDSHELEAVRTLQNTCVEASGTPTELIALLLYEEGQPGVKTHRYAGNAASGSPYKITVGKKNPALRGVQQTRKSAPLAWRLTASWTAAPLVTEALSVACKLGSMFGLKVQQGEQVDDSGRNPEDEMDFEQTSTVVAPVDKEVLMQDAPDLIDDGSSTDEMDWETASRLSLEEEGFLVRIFSALCLGPKLNRIADRVRNPASSGVTAEQKPVSTASQAPAEVNKGPHAPSATSDTATMGRNILSLRARKVPRKEAAESAVVKTLTPTTSTSVPPQAEVQTAVATSGNGDECSSSGSQVKAVSTERQVPVEVNKGPHTPSPTPKTVTVRKITLRVGGKKVPGKEVAESTVAKTPLPTTSTSVPPQAEVQTAVATSGNGDECSSSGSQVKPVSTESQVPVEVNKGPHTPSPTPKTVTVRKITLRVGGKKMPGKEVAESTVAKTPLPTTSTSVPPQAEVQTAVPMSGNGEGSSTSGSQVKAVLTASPAPVEVNQGPHAPSVTPKTVPTVRKIILRVGGKKVPGKEVVESAVEETLLPTMSTSVPPQPEV
ncbi:hypothetical protein L211DRAFT_852748 [Terfezia boudieri ATCC MYA-4762]|uniref:Uncharacterized protein n=1 Tax=Terfezia boudieri ATCC MYA-4762 TaxID=1051890 RepID=A0A3N4LPQ7_9PEZI|nr:hypothetical protein L211DRAFT_852748 [Terfezia boudieri ATCC MYA-4762]